MNDEFYIGYFSTSPDRLARHTRWVVAWFALVVVSVAALAAWRQNAVDRGVFEFGKVRLFEGVIYESPVPTLRMVRNGGAPLKPAVANFVLVGFGKHGPPDFARDHEGQKVRFKGSLIYRDNMAMVELNDSASFQVLGEPAANERRARTETIGEFMLSGELVDTKCFFGVMRPATGKVHRACAVRCLSGGVPPGLLVRDDQDNGHVVLLTGRDGKPLQYDVEWAARRIRCAGVLEQNDGLPVLRVSSMRLE